MLINFEADLEKGRVGEDIVYKALLSLGYDVENVANERQCYYKGDLKVNTEQGVVYVDAKLDNVLAKSGNVFCEEEKYFKDGGYYGIGDMSKDYDVMAVISPQRRKIYFFDADILKQIYKKGEYKQIDYIDETTIGYALPIWKAKRYNALLGVIEF